MGRSTDCCARLILFFWKLEAWRIYEPSLAVHLQHRRPRLDAGVWPRGRGLVSTFCGRGLLVARLLLRADPLAVRLPLPSRDDEKKKESNQIYFNRRRRCIDALAQMHFSSWGSLKGSSPRISTLSVILWSQWIQDSEESFQLWSTVLNAFSSPPDQK